MNDLERLHVALMWYTAMTLDALMQNLMKKDVLTKEEVVDCCKKAAVGMEGFMKCYEAETPSKVQMDAFKKYFEGEHGSN